MQSAGLSSVGMCLQVVGGSSSSMEATLFPTKIFKPSGVTIQPVGNYVRIAPGVGVGEVDLESHSH